MSVWSARFKTGVIRPPSGIATAIATLMLSAYVMPAPSGVHAAPTTNRLHDASSFQQASHINDDWL